MRPRRARPPYFGCSAGVGIAAAAAQIVVVDGDARRRARNGEQGQHCRLRFERFGVRDERARQLRRRTCENASAQGSTSRPRSRNGRTGTGRPTRRAFRARSRTRARCRRRAAGVGVNDCTRPNRWHDNSLRMLVKPLTISLQMARAAARCSDSAGHKLRVRKRIGHVLADRERLVDRRAVDAQDGEQPAHAAELAALVERGGLALPGHVRQPDGFGLERHAGVIQREPWAHRPRRVAQAQNGQFQFRHAPDDAGASGGRQSMLAFFVHLNGEHSTQGGP